MLRSSLSNIGLCFLIEHNSVQPSGLGAADLFLNLVGFGLFVFVVAGELSKEVSYI